MEVAKMSTAAKMTKIDFMELARTANTQWSKNNLWGVVCNPVDHSDGEYCGLLLSLVG